MKGEIMKLIYTGIGSRETPKDALCLMFNIAKFMAKAGWILRSGAADGADYAFEIGCVRVGGKSEIYVPWKGFNSSNSSLLPSPQAFDLAAKYHPAWLRCSEAAKKLHARNSHQVMGKDLNTPTDRIICWTKNAEGGGGTGQAIRIAQANGIPVHDLANDEMRKTYETMLKGA